MTPALQRENATLAAEKEAALANDKSLVAEKQKLVESMQDTATYKAKPFKFQKGATSNIMDYNDHTGNSFFRWQWKVMQDDVRLYYGK